MSPKDLPAISGKQLIRLLKKDGWEKKRRSNHGIALAKRFSSRTRVAVVPDKSDALPGGTLAAILGPMQTNLGRRGLLDLIGKYGLK